MLDTTFQSIMENPSDGKDCSDIRAGYRKWKAGSHVVFYRQHDLDTIEIVRVLHGRMDVETRLSER
jgi:toxin ParE1/3/4